ncbi:MAG: hypothetical protein K0S78_4146 [Thermomicrobiales bacterium]|nr:hypothetical protein [Thermomicrobiales bacterium]
MERQRTYEDLTSKQRWALQALVTELTGHPIAETIVESIRLRGLDVSTDVGKATYRRALGGGRAAQLIFSHILALHDANEKRKAIGRAIHEKMQFPYPAVKEEIPAFVEAELDAMMWAGRQEIVLQEFANLCIQLWMLVQKAAAAAGYTIPPDDLAFLNSFRPLRTYSAHIDTRLPGEVNQDEVVTEIETERGWQVIAGFEIDEQERVIIKGQAVEVNDPGFARVDEIIRRTLGALKPSAIAQMHQYFVQHPEDIPPVSTVRRGSLTRAAKPGERGSRAASAEQSEI